LLIKIHFKGLLQTRLLPLLPAFPLVRLAIGMEKILKIVYRFVKVFVCFQTNLLVYKIPTFPPKEDRTQKTIIQTTKI
jgi:hypothetical protein